MPRSNCGHSPTQEASGKHRVRTSFLVSPRRVTPGGLQALAAIGRGGAADCRGQSLIPLMKMRMARPSALVDINFIPRLSEIRRSDGQLRFGALARHADIEAS